MFRPGQRLRSQVCSAEYIVVKAPSSEIELTAGGQPVIQADGAPGAVEADPEFMGGSPLGKRYVDDASGLEILVTKPGEASLAVGGVVLGQKAANPLPSTD